MFKILLTANNLSCQIDSRTLFEKVNLSITNQDRIALIGLNGSGKSTLLKMLAKDHSQSTVSKDPTSHLSGFVDLKSKTAYFKQTYPEESQSILPIAEYLLQKDEPLDQVYTSYMRIWLQQLDFEKIMKNLSGGELTKLMIAIEAAKKPELFIVDEPTNNLDKDSIERLKEYIKYFQGGIIFVSHNLSFLRTVPNKIFELENGTLLQHELSYDEYQEYKAQKLSSTLLKIESLNKDINKIKKAYAEEKERILKVQSRQLKAKKKGNTGVPKIAANFFKNESEKSSGKRQQDLLKQISELKTKKQDLAVQSKKNAYLKVDSDISDRRLLLRISTRVREKDVKFDLYYGDRIVIEGPNGSGKTTLCKYIFNQAKELVKVAYLDQKYQLVDLQLSVIENMQMFNKDVGYEDCRRYLGNFLFYTNEDINKKAGTLSGGELVRLAFARVTAKNLELLILDEPLNNVDIRTQEVIVEGLKEYKGALVVVSHDEEFSEKINIQSVATVK